MAITYVEGTVDTNQNDYPSYRDIYFKLDSDDANIVNIVLVIRKGSTPAEVVRLRQALDLGSSDEFSFRIHEIIQDYLSSYLQYFTDPISSAGSAVTGTVEYFDIETTKEEVLSSGLVVDGATIPSIQAVKFYAHMTSQNWNLHPYNNNVTWSDFISTGANSDTRFFTNKARGQMHRSFTYKRHALQWLSRGTGSLPDRIRVRVYDSAGATINDYDVNLSVIPITAGRWELVSGIDNIAATAGAGFLTDISNGAYYSVLLMETSPSTIFYSEEYFYDLIDDCSEVAVHYLNPLGGFDIKYIASPPVYSTEINRSTFDKLTIDTDDYSRIRTNELNINARTKITFELQPVTLSQMSEIRELLESPEIYLQFKESTELIRYNIENNLSALQDLRSNGSSTEITFVSAEANNILR